MRRNQLPPHPVLRLMFLLNTLNQSSLRKMTLHPVIIIFLSGPPLFFFSKNSEVSVCIHPFRSLLFLLSFFVFIAIIIVLFLRRGVHINKKYLSSLLSFIQQRQVRGKCETAWGSQIGFRISAYNVCSNNMYFLFF